MNRHSFQISLGLVGAIALLCRSAQADEKATPPESPSSKTPVPEKKRPAAVSRLTEDEIQGFSSYAPAQQALVREAAELTTLNLTYAFGSCDPRNGGMDCSGTIYHLLQSSGYQDAPRQSDEMLRWIMRRSVLYRTENANDLRSPAFSAMRPGDLLFWSGTYETAAPRHPPISHVMIYLGKLKAGGKPVIFGASDGRTYEGKKRCGVSVFDFILPRAGDKSSFYGYGPLPAKK
jgi:cell wall-associated NlpC family hydrolase